MKPYWLVFNSGLQRNYEYRLDFMMKLIKYIVSIVLLAMVWTAVGSGGDNQLLTQQSLIMYYLGSALIFDISNFHTWYIEEDIKLGYLSKFLIKPISSYWYYFFHQASESLLDLVVKSLVLIPIIYWISEKNLDFSSLSYLIILIPVIFYFSFTFFFTLSITAFWLHEVFAIRWGWMGILRFVSGVWVPLYLFPEQFQKILHFTPFPHLVFYPIQLIIGKLSSQQAFNSLAILFVWCVIMTLIKNFVWKKGLEKYESSGG